MPAADSSSSRARSERRHDIALTLSLDGVVLDSSCEARSLSAIAEKPFDRLVVTLVPRLVGAIADGQTLPCSLPLELVEAESQPPNMCLIYRRADPIPTTAKDH